MVYEKTKRGKYKEYSCRETIAEARGDLDYLTDISSGGHYIEYPRSELNNGPGVKKLVSLFG